MLELQLAELSQMMMTLGRSLFCGSREKISMSSARGDDTPNERPAMAAVAVAANRFVSFGWVFIEPSVSAISLAEVGPVDRGDADRDALIDRDRRTRRRVGHRCRDVPFAVRAHRVTRGHRRSDAVNE